MKLLKKALALLLCLFCALSGCVFSASAETVEVDPAETKIYFEVPDDWNNWSSIFCHIYVYNGNSLTNWQSKKERCTQVEGNLYSYDTTRAGGLTEGVTYGVIMSANTGIQTYEAVLTTECLGDTLYCDGTEFENPVDFNKIAIAAYWRNQDPKTYGPMLCISYSGNVVGSCAVEPVSDIFLDFITGSKLDSARTYSGKSDQQIIDDVAYGLGLTNDEVAVLIEESGETDIHWKSYTAAESVEAKPIVIPAGSNGQLIRGDTEEDSYYYYDVDSLIEYTINFTDGTSKNYKGNNIYIDGESYWFSVLNNQSAENPWIAGNTYEVTTSILGKKVTFSITIEESHIKKVEVDSLVLTQGIDGHTDSDYNPDTDEYDLEYYRYDLDNLSFTITFTDGTVKTGSYVEHLGQTYDYYSYSDQSYENQWTPGNTYTVYVVVSDKTIPISVKILDTPVLNLEVVKNPDKTVFDKGECFNPEGAVIRINYTDSTYEDVTIGSINPLSSSGKNKLYIERLGKEFTWYAYENNEGNIILEIIDVDKVLIETERNPYEIKEITIKEVNAKLFATLTYENNATKTVEVLGTQNYGTRHHEGKICTGCIFYTDDGIYDGELYTDSSYDNFYIVYVVEITDNSVKTVTSNTLKTCLWWKLQLRFKDLVYAIAINAQDTRTFDGNVTAENIDNLLSIACHSSRVFYDDSTTINSNENYAICKVGSVRIAFYDLFGVMPDLKLSNNYNPADDTIKVYFTGSGGPIYDIPFAVESKDGTYTAQIHWGVSDYTITLDEDLYLTAYNIIRTYGILGDVNGDEDINIKDATVIQKHIAKLAVLTDTGKTLGDVNGDNDVNIKDATAIQKHIAGLTVNFPLGESVIK